MMDVRQHVRALLEEEGDMACLGAALMLMPPSLVVKAISIADQQDSIQRVFEKIAVFSVKGSTGEYLVVPYKYCSCWYYCENVMKQRLTWTCKHDLAVQLRLRLGGALKIHPAGNELLAKQLI